MAKKILNITIEILPMYVQIYVFIFTLDSSESFRSEIYLLYI